MGAMAASALVPGALRAEARRVITSSILVEDRRLWISASIDGSRPYLFIIDTGGVVSLIHERVARELDLRARGNFRLIGMGGPESFLMYEAHNVAFSGGAVQRNVAFGAASEELALGQGAAGTFAAGLFTAADSDFDFERGQWRLYPDGRGDRTGFTEVSSSIEHVGAGSPYVFAYAAIDGQSYRFLLDTGMPGQLMLWPQVARRSGLWNDAAPYAPGRSRGIGGAGARTRLVRANRFQIADVAFERPLVTLTEPSLSPHARDADGIIGLELLQRLTLSTDARRRKLWIQRNARPAPPERYPLSGLWVEARGDTLVVADVGPASPAATAGIREGDEIVGLDLATFLSRTAGVPGTAVPLRVRRAGQEREVTLNLRRFL